MRPQIVGAALETIGRDPEIEATMFEVLETDRIVKSSGAVILLPEGSGLAPLVAAME